MLYEKGFAVLCSINFCQQILHWLIDDRQKVAEGEQNHTFFINKHIGALGHAEETEGVVGFGGLFFGVTQEGEGKLVAFGKTFVGCLAVGADAEQARKTRNCRSAKQIVAQCECWGMNLLITAYSITIIAYIS